MRYFILLLISFDLLASSRISISHYPPYADQNKADLGAYPNYLRSFFKSVNEDVEFVFEPFARILNTFTEHHEINFTILTKVQIENSKLKNQLDYVHYDTLKNCVFYDKKRFKNGFKDMSYEKLSKYNMVHVLGSPLVHLFKKYAPNNVSVHTFKSAFNMVKEKRADIFVSSKRIGLMALRDMKDHGISCDEIDFSLKVSLVAKKNDKKSIEILSKFKNYVKSNPFDL